MISFTEITKQERAVHRAALFFVIDNTAWCFTCPNGPGGFVGETVRIIPQKREGRLRNGLNLISVMGCTTQV
jgi:hypothetical protein